MASRSDSLAASGDRNEGAEKSPESISGRDVKSTMPPSSSVFPLQRLDSVRTSGFLPRISVPVGDDSGDAPPSSRSFSPASTRRPEPRDAFPDPLLEEPTTDLGNAVETIDNPTRVREILNMLALHGRVGVIKQPLAPPLPVGPSVVDEAVGWRCEGTQPRPPFFVEIEGYNHIYEIPIVEAEKSPEGFTSGLPKWIARHRHRNHRRARVRSGIEVMFEHPDHLGLFIRRPVRDISAPGVGFWIQPEDRLYVSLVSDNIWLILDGEVRALLRGAVQSLPAGDDGLRCGMRVEPLEGHEHAWARFLEQMLYPTTARASDAEALWSLYDESGYFRLSGKNRGWFEERKASFSDAIERLSETDEMGCHSVWWTDDQAEAVVSALRLYTGCWFGSQMAKRPGKLVNGVPRRLVLRDIQLQAYELAYQHPDCRWMLTYVHENARFNMLMCKDFTERYDGTRRGVVRLAHALEVVTDAPAVERPAGVEITLATAREKRFFMDWMARRCPFAYRDALDLVPERLELNQLKDICKRTGFLRDRVILVARVRGRPVACAVADLGTDGLHLFGMYNVVRIFPFEMVDPSVHLALLDSARGFFRSMGKHHFVYFCDGEWSPFLHPGEGITDLGSAYLTILASELVPEWLEYMHEELAPRL